MSSNRANSDWGIICPQDDPRVQGSFGVCQVGQNGIGQQQTQPINIPGFPRYCGSSVESVGPMYRNASNTLDIGRSLVSTDLRGVWIGHSHTLYINANEIDPEDRTVKSAGAGQLFIVMNEDGTFWGTTYTCRAGGKLIRGDEGSAQIFYVAPGVYNLVNGVPTDPGYGDFYYPLFVNMCRNVATCWLLDSRGALSGNELFWEMQTLQKISNTPDRSLLDTVRTFSDQWVNLP